MNAINEAHAGNKAKKARKYSQVLRIQDNSEHLRNKGLHSAKKGHDIRQCISVRKSVWSYVYVCMCVRVVFVYVCVVRLCYLL